MIKRIVTGIQSSGKLHLGNILGAIVPALELVKTENSEGAIFPIADLHSLTTVKSSEIIQKNVYNSVATWIACGLDWKKNFIFRQSEVPEVCELMWYFLCCTPTTTLSKAHAYKEKSKNLNSVINAGLYTYPVLMAADIAIYGATDVPVGRDQVQHLEIARGIINRFNEKFGKIFPKPETRLSDVGTIIGTDGRKMSKSYNNTINLFAPEKDLLKQIMSIKTDSTPADQPKKINSCVIFNVYKPLASESDIDELKRGYEDGSMSYKKAKELLFEKIMETYKEPRAIFNTIEFDISLLDGILKYGFENARRVVDENLKKIRSAVFGI